LEKLLSVLVAVIFNFVVVLMRQLNDKNHKILAIKQLTENIFMAEIDDRYRGIFVVVGRGSDKQFQYIPIPSIFNLSLDNSKVMITNSRLNYVGFKLHYFIFADIKQSINFIQS
jgi:hypothetical protein